MTPAQSFLALARRLEPSGAELAFTFGKQGLRAPGGRAFGCLFHQGLALNLVVGTPEFERAQALQGAEPFDPFDKDLPFRGWIIVPHDYIEEWEPLARVALRRAG